MTYRFLLNFQAHNFFFFLLAVLFQDNNVDSWHSKWQIFTCTIIKYMYKCMTNQLVFVFSKIKFIIIATKHESYTEILDLAKNWLLHWSYWNTKTEYRDLSDACIIMPKIVSYFTCALATNCRVYCHFK